MIYIAAFAVILLLLAIFAWVLRRIVGANRQDQTGSRGRQPRLGIVDTFAIDRQRQLVIVRRDSVEHLLLLGGTTDLLIESNIVRAMTTTPAREPAAATKPFNVSSGIGNARPSGMAELSFASEPREPMAPAPMPTSTPLPTPPVQSHLVPLPKVIPVPRSSDLTEIAQRFQNTPVSPLIAEREPPPATATLPVSAFPALQTIATVLEDDAVPKTPSEDEPIIPAVERAASAHPTIPEVRDIGSLNDTLRQLLGRTREQ